MGPKRRTVAPSTERRGESEIAGFVREARERSTHLVAPCPLSLPEELVTARR
jgi:hypothetical protein